jgi:FkbM family methyltransferase
MTFYGQCHATGGGSDEPIDKILYDHYFTNQHSGVAIECGANDGVFLSSCLLFENIGWRVINVEASIANFVKLCDNRKTSVNIFCALSDQDLTVQIMNNYIGDNGGQNGIDYIPSVACNMGGHNTSVVSTFRYDTLFNNLSVDLFVLDVEGYELKVIDGMSNLFAWPKVICVEHTHTGLEALVSKLPQYHLDYQDELNAVFIR